mgnify:FL=1
MVKDVEMDIAKLRGWIVDKKQVAVGGMKDMEGVGYKELAGILNTASGRKELEKQGLSLQKLIPSYIIEGKVADDIGDW